MAGPRIGSLCTGYGGLDMAVQAVFGGELAWVSDVDPGACQIIAHRHPGVRNIGDLTVAPWAELGPVDILLGGYPCQPFSSAGLRKGTEDERHIWPYIADALRVLRPRLAVFENVAGHLRLGFDAVLADLARLGFDAEWCVASASEVGAPHQRKRLFLLAVAADTPHLGHERRRNARDGRTGPADHSVSAPDAERLGLQGQRSDAGQDPQRQAPAHLGCGPAGSRATAADAARLRHGDAGPAGERGMASAPVAGGAAAAADAARVGRGEGRPEPAWQQRRPDSALGSAQDWGRFAPAVARWEAVTGHRAPWATDDRGRLAPAFVEWMMGLPAGHVTEVPGLTRTQQLKALGNGVVPQQAEAAIRLLHARAVEGAAQAAA